MAGTHRTTRDTSTDEFLQVRLPAALLAHLRDAAAEQQHSLNDEIVERLMLPVKASERATMRAELRRRWKR